MADLHQLPSHSPWISEPIPPLSPAWAGQAGNEDSDILLLRQQWLAEELAKQDAELKHMRKLSIRVGTFNVNGQQPMEPLRSWLCSSNPADPPSDLIVVGFQELDLSAEALLISSTTFREDIWCEALMRDLAELGDQYVKRLGKAFVGMTEGPITFQPTYRCEIGQKEGHYWDSKRRPAWTDRILYQTARGKQKSVHIVKDSYKSHPGISISDHKPVSADFVVGVDELDIEMAANRLKLLVKKLGRLPLEEDVPRVKLSHNVIDWGTTLKASDYGCQFSEHRNHDGVLETDTHGAERLIVSGLDHGRTHGVLLPGGSVAIRVTTNVTNEIAAQLNAGTKTLEDIIILHTIRGKDTFVPVMGAWTRTCLAYSPDALVRLPGSVRDSPVSKRAQLSTEKSSSSPRELMRLVNWLMKCGVECDELFVKSGDHEIIDTIVEALDTGSEFPFDEKTPDQSVILSFGSALLLFLEEMPEPVVPLRLNVHCGISSSKEQAYEILDHLPSINAN
ncbi:hypothetical protein FRC07_001217, partial [Ceratobasidium sp. 392]